MEPHRNNCRLLKIKIFSCFVSIKSHSKGFAFAGIRNVSQIYLGYNRYLHLDIIYLHLHIYFLCYNNYFSLRNSSSSRIHTLSGYAFAGSENIAMMVINDNPIKTIDSFAFAGLKNVKFLLISSSVRHLHKVTKYIQIKPDQIKSMFRTSDKSKLNSVNEI